MSPVIVFFLKTLLNMAIQFGLPYVVAWMQQHASWLPIAEIVAIIQKLINQLESHKAAHPQDGPEYHEKVKKSISDATVDLHRVCSGVACPPDLKGTP